MNESIYGNRLDSSPIPVRNVFDISPKGVLVDQLKQGGLIFEEGGEPDFVRKTIGGLGQTTTCLDLRYLQGVIVPESVTVGGQMVKPMIYMNESNYCIPTDDVLKIPELITFEDIPLSYLLMRLANRVQPVDDKACVWVFPGGGGKYMRRLLEEIGFPFDESRILEIGAKRRLGQKGVPSCDIDLTAFNKRPGNILDNSTAMVWVDDALSSGSTFASAMQAFDQELQWRPSSVKIVTQFLSLPRKKEPLMQYIKTYDQDGNRRGVPQISIFTGVLYGGEVSRPRLLSTGSIIRGLGDPARFTAKNYPPELIERVVEVVQKK
ncbi:hypothetical protein HY214_02865 [Candidatus Roizmanbacteria bacterium]|nr:hypothetical protein [Candidatus Roizmanbacteria bacterium]